VAERGGQPDKEQREQDERRGDVPSEDEGRERENEGLRARLDKLSNALDTQQRDARSVPSNFCRSCSRLFVLLLLLSALPPGFGG
jgi:hypothetical protein